MSPRRFTTRAITIASWLVLVLASPRVAAQPPMDAQAKVHLDRGFEHYQAGEYTQAITELEKGYGVDPRPEFLFAWAQAARMAGRCALALQKYRAFIDAGATKSQVDAAQPLIDECEVVLEAEREQQRQREREGPAEPAPTSAPAPEPGPVDEPRDWRQDPAGGVLVGLGAAALVGGAGLVIAAQVRASAIANTTTYEEFSRELEQAQRSVPAMRIAGGVLMAAGAGLVVGGVLRYRQQKRRLDLDRTAVWIDRAFVGFTLGGRF